MKICQIFENVSECGRNFFCTQCIYLMKYDSVIITFHTFCCWLDGCAHLNPHMCRSCALGKSSIPSLQPTIHPSIHPALTYEVQENIIIVSIVDDNGMRSPQLTSINWVEKSPTIDLESGIDHHHHHRRYAARWWWRLATQSISEWSQLEAISYGQCTTQHNASISYSEDEETAPPGVSGHHHQHLSRIDSARYLVTSR